MEIIIDDREHDLIKQFDYIGSNKVIKIIKERINTGDIGLYYKKNLLIIIERKTWDDLSSSIKDGRLESQIQNMIKIRNDNPSIKIFILIEGKRRKSHGHIDSESMETKLYHIIIKYNIHIVYCKDLLSTAQYILKSAEKYPQELLSKLDELIPKSTKNEEKEKDEEKSKEESNFGEKRTGEERTGDERTGGELREKRKEETIESAIQALSEIPGISFQTSSILINTFSIIELLYTIKVDDLASLTYISGNKIGNTRAEKMLSEIRNEKNIGKMLDGINGIKKGIGIKIFDHMKKKLTDWTIPELSNYQKTASRKLGKKLASKIITIINYKSHSK